MRGTFALLALWIVASSGIAQEPEPPAPDAPPAEAPGNDASQPASVDELIATFDVAPRKEKRAVLEKLYALGEPAMKAVEARADAAEKALAAAEGEGKRDAKKAARNARKLRDGLYMQIIVSEFRRIDKKHPEGLTFAGQYDHMKKFGKRASLGALALLKDIDFYETPMRARAWEVLADLGDKSVMAELKDIADNYLFEDVIQTGAARALATLGDTSAIEKKVKALRKRLTEQGALGILNEIALTYSHARQYDEALKAYRELIAQLRALEERNRDEWSDEQMKGLHNYLATVYYNTACSYSLNKDVANAYAALESCLKITRERYPKMIERDGDLKNLRADPKFKAWFADAKKGKFPPRPEKPTDAAPPAPPEDKPDGQAGKPDGQAGDKPGDAPPAAAATAAAVDVEAVVRASTARWLGEGATPADRRAAVDALAAAGPAAARALEARAAANPAVAPLYAEVVRAAFERRFAALRKADRTLTFAGQFDDFARYGSGAAPAALAIFRDTDATMQDRGWAADALADLGDEAVIPALESMVDDFLFTDDTQDRAAYVLSALGRPKPLDAKIAALRNQNDGSAAYRTARLYYRGRRYREAIAIYRQFVDQLDAVLARADEMPAKAVEARRTAAAQFRYSLACNLSLAGDTDAAMKRLEEAFALAPDAHYRESIAQDGDLRAVRARPDYAAWLAKLGAKPARRSVDL